MTKCDKWTKASDGDAVNAFDEWVQFAANEQRDSTVKDDNTEGQLLRALARRYLARGETIKHLSKLQDTVVRMLESPLGPWYKRQELRRALEELEGCGGGRDD